MIRLGRDNERFLAVTKAAATPAGRRTVVTARTLEPVGETTRVVGGRAARRPAAADGARRADHVEARGTRTRTDGRDPRRSRRDLRERDAPPGPRARWHRRGRPARVDDESHARPVGARATAAAAIRVRRVPRAALAGRIHPRAGRGRARAPRARHDCRPRRARARRGPPCATPRRGPAPPRPRRRTDPPPQAAPGRSRRSRVRCRAALARGLVAADRHDGRVRRHGCSATRRASVGWWPTSRRTRSATRARVSRSRSRRPITRWCSRSTTTGPGYLRRIARGSSSASCASTMRAPEIRAAAGSVSRSSPSWSAPTAARSRSSMERAAVPRVEIRLAAAPLGEFEPRSARSPREIQVRISGRLPRCRSYEHPREE